MAKTSTHTKRRPGPVRIRRFVLILLLIVMPVAGLEVGLRVLIAFGRLPVAPAHTPEFEITWTNLERVGPADVLILGDSVSQQGIEPRLLADLIHGSTGRAVKVFNAASPGGTVGVNWALVNRLAAEGRLPKVAVVGVYPGTLKNDLTYREFLGRTPMGEIFGDCELTDDLESAASCRLSEISVAWRWRGYLDRLGRAATGAVPRRLRSGGLVLRSDGFREGKGVSLELLRRQIRRANLDRRLFAFPPDVLQGYERLFRLLEDHGVKIVAVAIPNTPILEARMEKLQPGHRQMFVQAIATIENLTGVAFVDPQAFGDWWGNGAARNFVHLSAAGARAFTAQLWNMPEFQRRLLDGLGAL